MLDLPTASALAFLPLPLQTHVFRALRERADRPARDAVVSASGDVPTLLADALRDRAHADAMWSAAQRDAELALKQGAAAGLQALPFGAALYPALLARIADPPPLLWLRGQASALAAPCIAVVGARAASPYGLQVAERIGAGLAAAGVTVVSGLARGVDSAAHRAASTIGRTVALLGSGADVIYPREHTALAADIVSRDGAIVSELGPGAPPRAGHFPRRNRLISGTSLAVVVIEASVRSGSLQTARFGLEQGREVMAVPGTVLGERFRGSHALLRDGAALVESAEDVLQELRWPAGPAATATDTMPADGLVGPREDRHPVLRTMVPGEAYDETQVVANTGLPAEEARRQLVLLEIDGQVLRTPGSRYVRHRRSRVERADG